jgi:hypothetical protein
VSSSNPANGADLINANEVLQRIYNPMKQAVSPVNEPQKKSAFVRDVCIVLIAIVPGKKTA